MKNSSKKKRDIEGHYNYYGVPAYILKQKDGAYASGFYDPIEGVFKAGGSVKKVLWDGIKVTNSEARRLIRQFSKKALLFKTERELPPDWVLMPEDASIFLAQSDKIHSSETEGLLRKLTADAIRKERKPEKKAE